MSRAPRPEENHAPRTLTRTTGQAARIRPTFLRALCHLARPLPRRFVRSNPGTTLVGPKGGQASRCLDSARGPTPPLTPHSLGIDWRSLPILITPRHTVWSRRLAFVVPGYPGVACRCPVPRTSLWESRSRGWPCHGNPADLGYGFTAGTVTCGAETSTGRRMVPESIVRPVREM